MEIDTGHSNPVSQKPYPIAIKHYDWVKDEINKLLDVKVICSRHLTWAAHIIVVPKAELKDFTIIDRDSNTLHYQAKEALHVHIKDPSLNRNIGKVRISSVFN